MTEPESSQRCTVRGQEANGHKLGNRKFKLDTKKNLPDLVEHGLSRRLDQMTTRGPFQPKFLCANEQLQYATREGK